MDNFNLSQEKLHTLKDDLRHLLNKLSIDNELGTPDFILAEMITEQINSMVVAKRKTMEHKGESLKTIQLEIQGIDDCYMKDTAHYKFKKKLKELSGESYTDFHDKIVDDLFEAILVSPISSIDIVGLMNYLNMKLDKKISDDATVILMSIISSISSHCEKFPFHDREELQKTLRDMYKRFNENDND